MYGSVDLIVFLCHNIRMSQKKPPSKFSLFIIKTLWIGYIAIFSGYITYKCVEFFSYEGTRNLYFFILTSFKPYFYLPYTLYLGHICLNIFHLITLGLYILRKPLFNQPICQLLLIHRILFDLLGQQHEFSASISLFHFSPKVGAIILAWGILFYFPSYIGCYRYAFGLYKPNENKIFKFKPRTA